MRFALVFPVILGLFFGGCAGPSATDGSEGGSPVRSAGASAGLPAFYAENGITDILYACAPAHVAELKPVSVLSLDGLSAERRALLAEADVASWKSAYEDLRVCDGVHWVLEFVRGSAVVKRVYGFNAEPPGMRSLLRACGVLPSASDDRDF